MVYHVTRLNHFDFPVRGREDCTPNVTNHNEFAFTSKASCEAWYVDDETNYAIAN
jgi:hypothetical protein